MFNKLRQRYKNQVKSNQNRLVNAIDNRLTPIKQYFVEKEIAEILLHIQQRTPENPVLHGYKVYSMVDEDGIIDFLFGKIGGNKTFLEIGTGDGRENNTHWLLLNDWKGVWVDGSETEYNAFNRYFGKTIFPGKFLFENRFIDLQNIIQLYTHYKQFLQTDEIDFFSLDIDGNDYHVLKTMFESGLTCKVICVEYNAKFPPGSAVVCSYDPNRVWNGSDYFGASLTAWCSLFEKFHYTLVCCNVNGVNAFFVNNKYMESFVQYPVAQLYQPARYHLSDRKNGHPASLEYLKNVLAAY